MKTRVSLKYLVIDCIAAPSLQKKSHLVAVMKTEVYFILAL